MQIYLAKYSGFCQGIKTAVQLVEDNISDNTITFGPVAHNQSVINHFKDKGVDYCEDIDSIENKKVIIRAHGVGPKELEKLRENNNEIIDGTCPLVTKVQKKAEAIIESNVNLLIIGDKNHPEIIGINGWANNKGIIINSIDELKDISLEFPLEVVVQTTFNEDKLEEIESYLIKHHGTKKFMIHNTICKATKDRQTAIKEMAQQVEVVLVIGGKKSSNTAKLTSICKELGVVTYQIEEASEIKPQWFNNVKKVGITAGASTPDWIIREVISMVNELSGKEFNIGDKVSGKIVKVDGDSVLVDIGYKNEAVITKQEFAFYGDNLADMAKVDEEVTAIVKEINDEGDIFLSKKEFDQVAAWENIEKAFNAQTVLTGKAVEVVKGGILIDLGIRAFMPASLVDTAFIEDLNQFVGQELSFYVKEIDKEKNKVILSRKDLLQKEQNEKQEKALASIKEGQRVKGIVKRIADFGAFVDIGGVDGLLHVSNLSWDRVDHPSKVLEIGQEVEVDIIEIDNEKQKQKELEI